MTTEAKCPFAHKAGGGTANPGACKKESSAQTGRLAARRRPRGEHQGFSVVNDRAESTKRNSTVGGFQPGALRKTWRHESLCWISTWYSSPKVLRAFRTGIAADPADRELVRMACSV